MKKLNRKQLRQMLLEELLTNDSTNILKEGYTDKARHAELMVEIEDIKKKLRTITAMISKLPK